MSTTNERNKFELVPRPPGALEKVEPGAKRVLSGMVADTLALVKKGPLAKPVFTVLIGHRDGVGDVWEDLIKQKLQTRYDLRFFRFGDAGGFYPGPDNRIRTEFLELVAKQSFDLILVYSHMEWGEIELFARLHTQFGKPIIATSGLTNIERDERLKAAGISVLPFPHSIEQFDEVLNSCFRPVSPQ